MGKRAYLLKILQDIRASYWFLPSVLVALGMVLAFVMGWVDRNPGVVPFELPKALLDTQADGARATLAVIAPAILGVTGVSFSMTLVAVTYASGNFGPRLIGNFMRDRGNQVSLGILISTFVYTLLVLRTVQGGVDGGIAPFVPQYSLIVALLLALVCVFTLIFFVHHVPETINVSRISADIGARLEADIQSLIDQAEDADPPQKAPERDPDHVLRAERSGYLQTVDFDKLAGLAEDNDWHLRLASPIGAFVTPRSPVLEVWCGTDSGEEPAKARAHFALGHARTEHQNPAYLAEQLVEMVARALSPGVNDPYTAVDCLNRLAAALTVAATYKGGLRERGRPRVTHPSLTFDRLFAASFPLCRQYILPDDLTRAHAVAVLTDLMGEACEKDRAPIRAEIRALTDSDG